jgi:hypothetical protein
MLGPTIYLPSGLAKLLIPLTTCRQMLPLRAVVDQRGLVALSPAA